MLAHVDRSTGVPGSLSCRAEVIDWPDERLRMLTPPKLSHTAPWPVLKMASRLMLASPKRWTSMFGPPPRTSATDVWLTAAATSAAERLTSTQWPVVAFQRKARMVGALLPPGKS